MVGLRGAEFARSKNIFVPRINCLIIFENSLVHPCKPTTLIGK